MIDVTCWVCKTVHPEDAPCPAEVEYLHARLAAAEARAEKAERELDPLVGTLFAIGANTGIEGTPLEIAVKLEARLREVDAIADTMDEIALLWEAKCHKDTAQHGTALIGQMLNAVAAARAWSVRLRALSPQREDRTRCRASRREGES